MVRRLARVAANLALALAATALTFLLFEVGARAFLPEWAPPAGDRQYWQHDPLLGWRHRPGQDGAHAHADFRVGVSINALGLRDRERKQEPPPGRRRLLLLGDSFAWGYGVEARERFGDRLEERHPEWEVVNAGVSGWGTDQQLLWFREEGRALRPDAVLLLFHPNDFLDNHASSRYGYRKPLFVADGERLVLTEVPVPRRASHGGLERWLVLHSYVAPRLLELPDLVAEAVEGWREPAESALPPPRAERRKARHLSAESEHVRVTHLLLRDLAGEVDAAGARLFVVSVRMVPHLREHLGEILAELDVPHLPLDPWFAGRPRTDLHFASDPHWNREGHRVVAEAVEEFLLAEGLLAPRARPGARPRSG
jgi:lysophospholipase L1-like esterase